MDNSVLKNAQDMCALIRSALAGETPAWEGMDLPAIHKLANSHALSAITYMALEGTAAEPQLDPSWKKERDMAVRKNLLMTTQRQQILRELDAMGCWYMPLKGSILADMYPKLGMRQMADNDILFDPKYRKTVKELFLGWGYECEIYGKSNHDVYLKPPVYNYEMHVALFNKLAAPAIESYYRDVETRLVHRTAMERAFTDEDFYLYFVAHGYKHFCGGGNGLRFLVDCYVILNNRQLRWDYVAAELKKLGLSEFEGLIRGMAHKLFKTGEALTQEEQEAFVYCLSSGTYGSFATHVANELKALQPVGELTLATKLRYLLRRLWPDDRWFQTYAPFFAKWWILKPFFLVWRLVKGIVLRGKNIVAEVMLLSKKTEGEK